MIKAIKTSSKAFLDYFLPRICVSCSTKLRLNEDTICDDCFNKFTKATDDRISFEYQKKFRNEGVISDFFSLFIFEKNREIQRAIHSLKYEKKFRVGIYLGKLLAVELKKSRPGWQFDAIVPIPLHQLKKAERGYNQSFYVSLGLKQILNKKLNANTVKRIKYTQSQTTMNLIERKENISGAFAVKRVSQIKQKNILLIDDVVTTGSTISECGIQLRKAGANKIFAASVAIAD